jgi:hypothetical protein
MSGWTNNKYPSESDVLLIAPLRVVDAGAFEVTSIKGMWVYTAISIIDTKLL